MTADLGRPAAQHGEPWTFAARDEDDTEKLGCSLGKALGRGGVVALIGPLGAGKTRLVQSIAAELGADRRAVNSPTFVLIQEYDAPLPIFHCDTYRLRSVDEFLDLGVDEMFQSGGVFLIEWAERVTPVLPADRLQIEIEVTGETARTFRFTALGPVSADVLGEVRARFASLSRPDA
ncbi:MAG TPA: tRNA (adenosine(37)-N6)-threonylcarbamoyltransferase complex ATPase subunit type 1 TsaE [Planctomycetaceae bacterium]|jgi:tRNA threonylcarbamoyladenosine biosynthesis protein TsaE|nr:tRNA (adenosine(37)-N6)-threonylcarbamoyltransferase complex ATPase subunit type 1 TsaE [Planctomycetaceae bacterium]